MVLLGVFVYSSIHQSGLAPRNPIYLLSRCTDELILVEWIGKRHKSCVVDSLLRFVVSGLCKTSWRLCQDLLWVIYYIHVILRFSFRPLIEEMGNIKYCFHCTHSGMHLPNTHIKFIMCVNWKFLLLYAIIIIIIIIS